MPFEASAKKGDPALALRASQDLRLIRERSRMPFGALAKEGDQAALRLSH